MRFPWAREQTQGDKEDKGLTPEQLEDISRAISEAITLVNTRNTDYETESSGGTGFVPTYGYERTDYSAFYELYHGMPVSGIQLGALLSQPVINLMTSFIIGRLPKVVVYDQERFQKKSSTTATDSETERLAQLSGFLNQFMQGEHAQYSSGVKTGLHYGDSYWTVGVDRHLEIISPYPTQCFPGFHAFTDRLRSLTTRVDRIFDNPETGEKIKGTITKTWNNETIEYKVESDESLGDLVGNPDVVITNTFGEIPVVHFANNREAGNVFGISELRPLIPFMNIIHSTIVRGWEAQQYTGRPILKVTKIKGSVASWLFKTFGIRIENAAEETDTLKTAMFNFFKRFKFLALSDEADANYIESKYVSGATEEIVRLAFQLFINVSLIPEFLFGSAIESSNAAVREQYVGLRSYVEKKQAELEPLIVKTLKLALYYYSTITRDEETGQELPSYPFISNPEDLDKLYIKLIWPPFLNADAAVKAEALKMLLDANAMSIETALENYQEYVPDARQELTRIRNEHADESLPTRGKQSGQDEKEKRATQRRNDDKGSTGDNSGRVGRGTGTTK
jgi:hypothetical protein